MLFINFLNQHGLGFNILYESLLPRNYATQSFHRHFHFDD